MRQYARLFVAYLLVAAATTTHAGVFFARPTPPLVPYDPGLGSPILRTDDAGSWVAVWSEDFFDDLVYARSTDDGQTWSTPTSFGAVADAVVLDFEADTSGTFIVALKVGTASYEVRRSTDGGLTWGAAQPFGAGIPFAFDITARLASDASGNWLAIYNLDNDCDIGSITSADDGVTWGSPVQIMGPFTSTCRELNLATDGSGVWIAVWNSFDTLGGTTPGNGDVLISRSLDAGSTWSNPVLLNPPSGKTDVRPALATDGAGTWMVTWRSEDDLGGTLTPDSTLVSRSTDDGATWSYPVAMERRAATLPEGGSVDQLIAGGGGVWLAIRSGPFGNALNPYSQARTTDDGDTWSVGWVPRGGSVATDGGGAWIQVSVGDEGIDARTGALLCTTPLLSCRAPFVAGRGRLSLKSPAPGRQDGTLRDGGRWGWVGGAATTVADFGDPLTATDYTLCIFDTDGRTLLGARVPAGGTCRGRPCWQANATGFAYKARGADTAYDVTKITLKAGDDGRAKIKLGGRGAYFNMPQLGEMDVPLLVQLEASTTGVCWESTYSVSKVDTDTKLTANAD